MKQMCARFLAVSLLFALLVAASIMPSSASQDRSSDIKSIDQEIQYLQFLLAKYDKGDYYLVGITGFETALIAVSKDEIANSIATMVLLGRLPSSRVAATIRALKQFSDQSVVTIKGRIAELKALRLQILNPPKPSVKPGSGAAKGYFRLKPGFPKFVNQAQNGPGFTFDYNVSGNTVSIHYNEVNRTTGKTLEDFTMTCTFSGMGKTTLDGGEELAIILDGTWTYATDREMYDGFGPSVDWRGAWISLLDAQPRHGALGANDSSALWLGRYTSGKVYDSDHRKITVKLAKSGTSGTEYTYLLNFGRYGQLLWTYEWVAF